jgi:hypothetical protein
MFKLEVTSPTKGKISEIPLDIDFHQCFTTSDGEHWQLDYSPYQLCTLSSSEKILALGKYPGQIFDCKQFETLLAEVNKHWNDWEKSPSPTEGTLSVWACCAEEKLVFARVSFPGGEILHRFYFQNQPWTLSYTGQGRSITVDRKTQTLTISEAGTLSRVYGVQEPAEFEQLWKAYIETRRFGLADWLQLSLCLLAVLLFYALFSDKAAQIADALGSGSQRF